jgi:hypothetical protein
MGLKPEKVKYLARAGTLLGNLEVTKIQEIGERVETVRNSFSVLEEFCELTA